MLKKRIVSSVLALCLLICLLPQPALAVEAEPADEQPRAVYTSTYIIRSVSDLLELAELCRLDSWSRGCLVALDADLDLSDTAFSGIPTFGGCFDGGGHTITGFTVETSGSYQGFFRYIQPGATVKDLHIQGDVACSGSTVGGIAGSNSGNIIGCSFTGNVSGTDAIGGIAGCNETAGVVESCSVQGSVHGSHFIGGMTGKNSGVIRNCENHAAINASAPQNTVRLEDITLENITNTEAAITATDFGGIAGSSSGVIRSCTNRGTVGYLSMGYNAGGIAGSQTGFITQCQNYGTVYARKEAGGIVGQMEPSNILQYSVDTLQVLQGHMEELGSLTSAAGYHAAAGGNQLSGHLDTLKGQAGTASDAIRTLLEQLQNGGLPDTDNVNAAISTLSTTISGMSATMGKMGSSCRLSLRYYRRSDVYA